jgi:hypothetical protein
MTYADEEDGLITNFCVSANQRSITSVACSDTADEKHTHWGSVCRVSSGQKARIGVAGSRTGLRGKCHEGMDGEQDILGGGSPVINTARRYVVERCVGRGDIMVGQLRPHKHVAVREVDSLAHGRLLPTISIDKADRRDEEGLGP